MIVGGYSLDLYCRVEECEETENFGGENFTEAKRYAKRRGWRFIQDDFGADDVLCPKCLKRQDRPSES